MFPVTPWGPLLSLPSLRWSDLSALPGPAEPPQPRGSWGCSIRSGLDAEPSGQIQNLTSSLEESLKTVDLPRALPLVAFPVFSTALHIKTVRSSTLADGTAASCESRFCSSTHVHTALRRLAGESPASTEAVTNPVLHGCLRERRFKHHPYLTDRNVKLVESRSLQAPKHKGDRGNCGQLDT